MKNLETRVQCDPKEIIPIVGMYYMAKDAVLQRPIIFDQKNELLHGTACLGYGVYHTMFVLATIYGVPLIEKLVKTL